MKTITTLEEYDTITRSTPHSIIIFSSLKTCHPCRLLKKWIEEKHASVEHIYEIDVMLPEFESIANDIDCLPTITYYQLEEEQKKHRLEGFNQHDVETLLLLVQQNKVKPSSKKSSVTLL